MSRWRWWIHLIFIGGYFIPPIVFAFSAPQHGPMLTSTAGGLLIACGAQLGFFALAFAIGVMTSRASRDDLLLRWRPGWFVLPLGVGYSVAIRLVAGLIAIAVVVLLLLTHVVTTSSLQHLRATAFPDVAKLVDVYALRHDSAYFWLAVTLGSFVLAGLREEMWRSGTLAALRALWPRAFGSRGGEYAGVVLIAVMFGAAHLRMGVIAALLAGVLGCLLGGIMLFHRSIWPAVLAHGFFDATSFALLPYALAKLQHLPVQ